MPELEDLVGEGVFVLVVVKGDDCDIHTNSKDVGVFRDVLVHALNSADALQWE